MSESDDPGMGIVKRRRSRRLLEKRTAASKGDKSRITSESAAAAWGDILAGDGALPDQVFREISTPPPARQPAPSPRIVELQAPRQTDEFSRPVRGTPSKGPSARILTPNPSSNPPVRAPVSSPPVRVQPPSSPPKAQMRGVPLSNRPGAIAPPDEDARAARVSEAPRKRASSPMAPMANQPSSRPAPVADPAVDMMIIDEPPLARSAQTDETADFEADNSLLREALRASPPDAAFTARSERATPPVNAATPPEDEAEETFEIEDTARVQIQTTPPAARGKRTLGVIVVVLLFIGACVWSAAILFDEVQGSARLNRVADTLDSRVARIVADTPQLGDWVKARDAAMLQELRDRELPLFRETLTATGYAAGVPKVKMLPDSTTGRMIFEVNLPDATLALDSDGKWIESPPPAGFGAALQLNVVPIVVGFSIPTIAAIALLLLARRRED